MKILKYSKNENSEIFEKLEIEKNQNSKKCF